MEAAKASVGVQETSCHLPPLPSVLERGRGGGSPGTSWKCSQTRCWLGTLGYAPAILPPDAPPATASGTRPFRVSSVLKRDQTNIQTQRRPRRLRPGVQAEEREDQRVQGRLRSSGSAPGAGGCKNEDVLTVLGKPPAAPRTLH
ncbi:unnamed protein product [Rangifer tarandus platyrhynchus]